jgi:hypothetical protein
VAPANEKKKVIKNVDMDREQKMNNNPHHEEKKIFRS